MYAIIFGLTMGHEAFSAWDQVEVANLKKAVKEGNFKRFDEILSPKSSPFKSGFFNRKQDSDPDSPVYIGDLLLKTAVEQEECRNDFVKLLVEKGARPIDKGGSWFFDKAARQGCLETVKALTPLFNDTSVRSGAGKTRVEYENTVKIAALQEDAEDIDQDKLKRSNEVVLYFANMAKEKCPSFDAKNVWCTFLDNLKASSDKVDKIIAKVKAEEDEQARLETPEGLREQACEALREIKKDEVAITREKAIGKASGVMDAKVLHSNGVTIQNNKMKLKEIERKYFKNTARKLDLSCT